MDLTATIRELYQRKAQVERAIAQLEVLDEAIEPNVKPWLNKLHRRGRKSMPEHERREVSERMKQYWKTRRQENKVS